MLFVNQIKSILSKYSYDWFLGMKNLYQTDKWYSKEHDKILTTYTDTQTSSNPENDETETNEIDIVIDFTLEQFCWNYKNKYYSTEEFDDRFKDSSIFFIVAISDVIQLTKNLLLQVGSIDEKDKLLKGILNLIEEECNNLSEGKPTEYKKILEYIFQRTREEFGRNFITISDVNLFINQYHDKLEFNLNQEELAVLLSVLIDADILTVNLCDTKNIRKFAERYFHITHGKTKKRQPAKSISSKMNDYLNNTITPATIVKVKKQLRNALK